MASSPDRRPTVTCGFSQLETRCTRLFRKRIRKSSRRHSQLSPDTHYAKQFICSKGRRSGALAYFQVRLAEMHRTFSWLRKFVWVRATPPRGPAATAPIRRPRRSRTGEQEGPASPQMRSPPSCINDAMLRRLTPSLSCSRGGQARKGSASIRP